MINLCLRFMDYICDIRGRERVLFFKILTFDCCRLTARHLTAGTFGGQMYQRSNVPAVKCPGGQMSGSQMSGGQIS